MAERYKPNVTVACIIHHQGKFVMVEESIDGKTRYNQPAGHLEANETMTQACIREVKEETGLEITPNGLVGIYQFQANEDLAFIRFTFFAELNSEQKLTPEDPQIIAAHWHSLEEIQILNEQLRSPLVIKTLKDYLNGKRYPLALLQGHNSIAP